MNSNMNMNMKSLLVIVMMIALVLMAILPLLNMVPVAARDDNRIPIPPIPIIYPDMYIECLEDNDIMIELDQICSTLDEVYVKYSGDNLICNINEDYISIIPKDNWYGEDSISIDILDDPNGWQRITALINVISVNDAPEIITGSTDVFMTSGSEIENAFNLNDMFRDVDSRMSFYWVSLNKHISLDIDIDDNVDIRNDQMIDVTDIVTFVAYDGEIMTTYDMSFEISSPRSINMDEDSSDVVLVQDGISNWNILNKTHSENIDVVLNEDTMKISPDPDWFGNGNVEMLLGEPYPSINPPEQYPIINSVTPPPFISPPITNLGILDYLSVHLFGFVVDVKSVNDPLTSMDLPAIETYEDSSLDNSVNLEEYFDDIDSTLTFSQVSQNDNLNVIINNGIVSLEPTANWFGTEIITIESTDGEFSLQEDLRVTVHPINDPPSATGFVEISIMEEDGSIVLNLSSYFDDIDSEMEFTYISDENFSVELNLTNKEATVMPNSNWNGEGQLTIYASDEDFQVLQNFDLLVTPVNDIPYVSMEINDMSFDEDGDIEVDITKAFEDVDSDLHYSLTCTENNIYPNLSDDYEKLMLSSMKNWHGSGSLTISATDGEYTLSQNVNIVVNSVNDKPSLESADLVRTINEDSSLVIELDALFSDVDSELSYETGALSNFDVVMDTDAKTLLLTPEANWYGLTDVTISSSDEEFEISQTLMIQVQSVNDLPQLMKEIPAIMLEEADDETILDMNEFFTDADGDTLAFKISGAKNITIDSNDEYNVFKIRNSKQWSGAALLELTVTDGTDTVTHELTVISTQVETQSTASAGLSWNDMMMLGGFAITAIALVLVTGVARHRIRTLSTRMNRRAS